MKLRNRLLGSVASALAALWPFCAQAQTFPGRGHAGTVLGVPGSASAPFIETTPSAMLDRAFGSTPGTFALRGSSAWTAAVLSGDCSLSLSGVVTCTKTNGVPFASIATSGSASDLGTGTLPGARLPTPSGSVLGGVLAGAAGANQVQTGVAATGAPVFAALPTPTASLLGGALAAAAPANQFQTGITTSGAPTFAQPVFANLAGALACTQTPAETGDISSPAGSCVYTLATVATAGTVGSSTTTPVVTIDAKGRTTTLGSATIAPPLPTLPGQINPTQLPTIAPSSVLANGSASSGTPTAVSIDTCGVGIASQWNGSKFACIAVSGGASAFTTYKSYGGL